jgi:hypothetical protein
MATIGIHNIDNTEVKIKHFDNFSVINLSMKTKGKYDDNDIYEGLDLYFETPEKLSLFMYAISNVIGELVES